VGFVNCAVYLSVMGFVCMLLGRLLPACILKADNFYFRTRPFERDGAIYEKLGIRMWHKRLPDMSKFFPRLIPPKKMTVIHEERLAEMIRETCNAELVHWITSLLGLFCLYIWPGIGGVIVVLIDFFLLNLPFIIIQRYNRPRLLRLAQRYAQKHE